MSNLYFLERMMIQRMREVARRADARARLGLHSREGKPPAGRIRRLAGAWLIRAGRRLQQTEVGPRGMTRPILVRADNNRRLG
jgi:hypothetical protein